MAYTPRTIKDRVAVGDDIFLVEDLGNNRIRLTPAPTHVSEAGTPVNKALLQPIEDELGNLSTTKVDKVSGKGLSTNDFTTALLNKLNGLNIKVGTYQGGGSGSLDIPLGFTPTIVMILNVRLREIAFSTAAYTNGYAFLIHRILGYDHEMEPIMGLDMELMVDDGLLINGQTLTVSRLLYLGQDTYAYLAL